MNGGQGMISRNHDVNTPVQLALALFLSAFAHAVFFAALISFSLWSPKHKIIVPGYKVDLVTLTPSRPASLLPPGPPPLPVEPEKPKPADEPPPVAEPKVKAAPPPPKKTKSEPMVKEKTAEAPKKIMAKSDDQPKKEIRKEVEEEKKRDEPEPSKAKPLPPIETASIPSGPREPGPPSAGTPRTASGGGGGLVTEGLAFPHIWYLQILERKANENWITHGIIIAGKRADPVVRFHILKSGRVDGLALEKSSGNAALDESALVAITKAAPFPPLPADYGSDQLTVHFTFTYEQRD
jgi:TonB family protein